MTDTTPSPATSTLVGLDDLLQRVPGLTRGSVRHLLFIRGHDLPGVYRFGRRVLFDPSEFIDGIKSGATATIAGRDRGAA